jgi:hypothetical protein
MQSGPHPEHMCMGRVHMQDMVHPHAAAAAAAAAFNRGVTGVCGCAHTPVQSLLGQVRSIGMLLSLTGHVWCSCLCS